MNTIQVRSSNSKSLLTVMQYAEGVRFFIHVEKTNKILACTISWDDWETIVEAMK